MLPRRHVARLLDLTHDEVVSLAELLKHTTTRYDNLFSCSFPYSMGFHQAPFFHKIQDSSSSSEGWHLHLHFYPPLIRSPTIKKHMVGFELLAMAQRDLTPEMAAQTLRNLSPSSHYKDQQQ
jgi:UDPglucose--hexose-1-phosphate uridylyltransferase